METWAIVITWRPSPVRRRPSVNFSHSNLLLWKPDQLTNMATTGNSDWLIYKKYSPLKPPCQMNQNLVGSIYERSFIKSANFGPFRKTKHARHWQFLFLISLFKKSSSLKPLGQMNRSLVGSLCGRSSINIAHFVPIRSQTWPPEVILISDF
jgi:hypothetical protein